MTITFLHGCSYKTSEETHTFRDDSDTLCDGFSSDGMIASDHDDFDSSTSAFAHSIGDSSTWRVNHTHQTNEAQILEREVRDWVCFWVELESDRELVS